MTFNPNSATQQIAVSTLSAASQHAYTPEAPPPPGLTAVTAIPNPATGQTISVQLLASSFGLINPEVWRDNSGNIIIAFRGTNPLDTNDQAADVAIMRGEVPLAAEQAADFARAIVDLFPPDTNFVLTGHSLGGYEAQYAGVWLQDTGLTNVAVVASNGPALPPSELTGEGHLGAGSYNSINFITPGDGASAYTQYVNGGQFSGEARVIEVGPTGLNVFNMVSLAAQQWDALFTNPQAEFFLAAAFAAALRVEAGHTASGMHTYFTENGMTLGQVESEIPGPAFGNDLYWIMNARPQETARILWMIEDLIRNATGFGTGGS